jgi:hypothetical protein
MGIFLKNYTFSGVVDNSTFRMYLTSHLRPVEVAKFNMMTDTNALAQVLPPDQVNFEILKKTVQYEFFEMTVYFHKIIMTSKNVGLVDCLLS